MPIYGTIGARHLRVAINQVDKQIDKQIDKIFPQELILQNLGFRKNQAIAQGKNLGKILVASLVT